jgi:hypothetical protein
LSWVILIGPYAKRLPQNAHLPFDMLTALSETEGLRYPHPSSLRRMRKAQGIRLKA